MSDRGDDQHGGDPEDRGGRGGRGDRENRESGRDPGDCEGREDREDPEKRPETLAAVVDRVRERVTPDAEERERLRAAVEALTERAEAAIAELAVEADVVHVGSSARGTWLAGDRDIDLFVRFPADFDRERLEDRGLAVGRAVLPDGREEYAEHPYVSGTYDGFDVDVVPCYDVPDAAAIRSAVDRSPFHDAYLADRLTDDLRGEVRVFKRFLKGIGAYGSDLRTRGFSGYLSELLVAGHGGFRPLIEAAADWHPPLSFDPEAHGRETFDDPLTVIDPTDPERNVAAVLSATNLARLQHYARDLLSDPRTDLFFRGTPRPLDREVVRAHVAERGTTPIAVVFEAPDVVEDQLYPQLRRSRAGIADELARRGFEPLRTAAFAGDRAVLLFELAVAELPAVERHEGPPVDARRHAEGFYEKYADADAYGPFLDGERYVVERERRFASATAFLRSDAIFEVALGARVETALQEDYDLLVGPEIAALADEFGTALARYFEPRP